MSSIQQNFDDYTDECVDEMSSLQEEFMKLYDIPSYEEWFYDHRIGAFHFKSDDGRNLYFKYVSIGSFSTERNTWKWSWDNKSTPEHVKRPISKIKAFGEANNFKLLTQGLIDGDEYTGWAMTSISAKLLNAIGMYRIPQEHLFSYFIFTNELSQEQYDSIKDKYIACGTHDIRRVAFICQHLNKDKYTGFHEAFESDPLIEEEDDYQAWCNECEKERLKENGWNDISMAFAKIQAVCDQCYFEIKRRNQLD
jgi:hypothetical protein